MSNFTEGETVYYINSCGYIGVGKIKKIRMIDKESVKPIALYTIENTIYPEYEVFKTFDEAISYIKKEEEIKEKEYENQIINLPELFSFMLSHMYEEHTDFEAIEVAKNKIKELVGIEL